MSLDVYLNGSTVTKPCVCPQCENEHEYETVEELYWANITHNLNNMAEAAGIYQILWRPDENDITKARELIAPLEAGLAKLKADPDYYKRFDAANGWGKYVDFVPWLERYLAACREHPEATVHVSR